MTRGLLLAAWALVAPALAADRVVDFHSAIRINADGTLEVTERIALQAEGKRMPGIVRDLPTRYRDRFGNQVTVPFDVRRVLRNGAPEPWKAEGLDDGVRIRVGRVDAALAPGTHVYEIRYATARQIGHFADHDELYWNVNGNRWSVRVDHISAEVHLPQAVPGRELRAEAYTGPQGARGQNYRHFVRDGAVGFTSTAAFRPHEGMTIVVGFPKGIVAEPGFMRRTGWFLEANAWVAAGVAGVALLLALAYGRRRLIFARSRVPAPRAPSPPA